MAESLNDTQMGVGRLEAFSDGVFGVAVTLLVLNIQLPHLPDSAGADELLRQLVGLWPAYLSYFITFVSLGTLWISHHQIFKYFRRVDVPIQLANLMLLMLVTLTPFTTALMADSIAVTARLRVAVIISGSVWTLMGLLIRSMGRYSLRTQLLKPSVDAPRMIPMSRSFGLGTIIGFGATLFALVSPEIAVAIFLLIALEHLRPLAKIFWPAAQVAAK